MMLAQTGLNLDEGNGNGFQNPISAIASSSANDESLVRPAFSFPEHCSISNIALDTSSSFQPSIKVHVGYF